MTSRTRLLDNPISYSAVPATQLVSDPTKDPTKDLPTTYWNKPEDPPPTSPNLILMYYTLEKCKQDPIFCNNFAQFAKNSLRLDNVNCIKGCRINLNLPDYIIKSLDNGKSTQKGVFKLIIFWFQYRQDGIVYNFAYESDDYTNVNGIFFQWRHQNTCFMDKCNMLQCQTRYIIR